MDLLTQADVEENIYRLLDRLEIATRELADLTQAAARTEVAFKKAYATAYVRATGAVKEREQLATELTISDFEAHRMASAILMAQQELLRTLRTQLDALRTLAANIRGIT